MAFYTTKVGADKLSETPEARSADVHSKYQSPQIMIIQRLEDGLSYILESGIRIRGQLYHNWAISSYIASTTMSNGSGHH